MPTLNSIDLDISLTADNDDLADTNRQRMEAHGAKCVNIMSSPGSGKTTLLEATLEAFKGDLKIAVMEGDMTTELDADRLRACGAPVAAITTGRSCHLESDQIARGLDQFEQDGPLSRIDLFVIENVGNLICPAAYDLGEHVRVVLVAVTEGDDKPLKYPIMFHGADCVVITKIDIAPYLKIDLAKLEANIRTVNSTATVFSVSSESGAGMDQWLAYLKEHARVG
ncbi:MAG TPA: hydrogenase nickel incorporation protein HypB [Capsulimonadaceae bacterium]